MRTYQEVTKASVFLIAMILGRIGNALNTSKCFRLKIHQAQNIQVQSKEHIW